MAGPGPSARLPLLGLETRQPSAEEGRRLSLKTVAGRPAGRLVISVAPEGPAARAGIVPGDLVAALDGQPLYSQDSLEDLLGVREPGQEATLTVKRGDPSREEPVRVLLGAGGVRPRDGIRWAFAGLDRLSAALARAALEGRPLLVGISGAET